MNFKTRSFSPTGCRAGTTEVVRELALASARDGDLIHDAARRTDAVILRHLAEPRDACAVELQIQVSIEAGQRANLHGSGTADADIHWHRAQQQKTETVGSFTDSALSKVKILPPM